MFGQRRAFSYNNGTGYEHRIVSRDKALEKDLWVEPSDSFFKDDEVIRQIKLNEEEKTNWRRVKNPKPVRNQ